VVRAAGLDVRGRRRSPEAGAEGGEEGGLGHGGGRWERRLEDGEGGERFGGGQRSGATFSFWPLCRCAVSQWTCLPHFLVAVTLRIEGTRKNLLLRS
jgi:hypothetical protein